MVRRTRGASAGSRRGSQATTTRSASSSPVGRVDRDHPPAPQHQVAHLAGGVHVDLARRQPCGQGLGQHAHAAGHGPRAEPLLDVRRHPDPGRHVARVVALREAGVQRHQPKPVVLEASDPPRHRLAAPEPRGQRRGQVVGVPRPLEVLAAQHLPVVGVGVDVVGPPRAEPGAERVDGLDLRRPGARRQPDGGAVGEPVLAQHVQLDQVELALGRPSRLAEQVAHHGREQGVRRPAVPREPVALDGHERAAEPRSALEQGDLVAGLGQAGSDGHPPEPAAHDGHPRHGATIVSAGRAPRSGRRDGRRTPAAAGRRAPG